MSYRYYICTGIDKTHAPHLLSSKLYRVGEDGVLMIYSKSIMGWSKSYHETYEELNSYICRNRGRASFNEITEEEAFLEML